MSHACSSSAAPVPSFWTRNRQRVMCLLGTALGLFAALVIMAPDSGPLSALVTMLVFSCQHVWQAFAALCPVC